MRVQRKLDLTGQIYSGDMRKKSDAILHQSGFRSGKHGIRMVMKHEPFTCPNGCYIGMENLVVFR